MNIRRILEALKNLVTLYFLRDRFEPVVLDQNFSIMKMYISLLPQHPKVFWKILSLHPNIHSRHKFIVWLAVQRRLSTVVRLLKFAIQVPISRFQGGDYNAYRIAIHINIRGTELKHWQAVLAHLNTIL